mmetsp:Transcript_7922/g.20167  ORF Transcript_7922/g.20167 Transcript_7922/m.20167 type:complete len:243 (+) Transcript_7922:97-825(+)
MELVEVHVLNFSPIVEANAQKSALRSATTGPNLSGACNCGLGRGRLAKRCLESVRNRHAESLELRTGELVPKASTPSGRWGALRALETLADNQLVHVALEQHRRGSLRAARLHTHHARSQLAIGAFGATHPHVRLNTAEVCTAKEAKHAVRAPLSTPRVFDEPVIQARGCVRTPADNRKAVPTSLRTSFGGVVNAKRLVVEKLAKVLKVVDAHMQRPVGHELNLHFLHLLGHERRFVRRARP